MQDEDYMNFIKEKIELEKLLVSTSPEYHLELLELLEKKKKIIQKNGFFANFQLNKINKKIEKIKQLSKS